MDEAAARAVYEPAALRALEAFGIEPAALTFANISENVTFKVTETGDTDAEDGAAYVLRLHRPWYHSLEELTSERLWTHALSAAGVATPQPVPTPGGEDYARVAVEGAGERRWAGISRWIGGEILFDVLERETEAAAGERHFESLGATMAAMHNQASAWTPPPGFRRHALDADGLMGETPFWGPFWDHAALTPGERSLLLTARETIHAALLRLGQGAAIYSVIHADLHPGNVLIDGDHLAVIDFDDAGFGWHAYDLAVALVHQRTHANFAGFRDACVRGYRKVRAISDGTLGQLPMFMLIRDMVRIGWLHQRPELRALPSFAANKDSVCERARHFEPPC
jgi:Ser/Thr protein kinase RdoA (MazF antagonist)